jgi:hypothetical protein
VSGLTQFELTAEKLARTIDRRTALRRAAETAFLTIAAFSAGGMRSAASAVSCKCPCDHNCLVHVNRCNCSAPRDVGLHGDGGRHYCTEYYPGGCNGWRCAGKCHWWYHDEWSCTACWCTTNHNYACGSPGNSYSGHYKCCDCRCGCTHPGSCDPTPGTCPKCDHVCGCRVFVFTCPSSIAGVEVPVTGGTDLTAIVRQLAPPARGRAMCCNSGGC